MSILIINETTAAGVNWNLGRIVNGSFGTVLASGTLKDAAVGNVATYNPPSSFSGSEFYVNFFDSASGYRSTQRTTDQSEVSFGPTSMISTGSGISLRTDLTNLIKYTVVGQATPTTPRAVVASGLVGSGSLTNIGPSALGSHAFFDVAFEGVGAGISTDATVTVQKKTRITLASFAASYAMIPAPNVGSGQRTPACS